MSSAFGGFDSRRLWSLWEIMHEIKASEFMDGHHRLSVISQLFANIPDGNSLKLLHSDVVEKLAALKELHKTLNDLGLSSSGLAVSRVITAIQDVPTVSVHGMLFRDIDASRMIKLKALASQAVSRIPDDFHGVILLAIEPRYVPLYKGEKSFADQVFQRFTAANEDIFEAGCCLAVGRVTATVMHLMRVLEVGLAALASELGVAKKNDWGSYLREIDKSLITRFTDSGARTPEEQFYAEVAASLDAMRRAWRNPTMHPE